MRNLVVDVVLVAMTIGLIAAFLAMRRLRAGFVRVEKGTAEAWRDLGFGHADLAEAWREAGDANRAAYHEKVAQTYGRHAGDLQDRLGR